MAFDIGLKFSVETAELLNARNALQSLAQAAKDLNNNQDKAAGAADKLAESNDKVAAAADKAEKATGKTSRSAKDMAGETDAAAAKLQKLNDQLGYLRNDLNLSETGFTKSQAGVLAWAKSVGASESIIKDFAGAFDKFNKAIGEQSLDKSVNGLSMLNRQLREFEQLQQLAKDEVTLTSTQVKMLARDMEILKQQNEAFNRESSYGVVELKNNFIEAAKQVNNYAQQAKEAEKAEKERAAVVAATAKANMDVMEQAVAKYWEAEQKKTAILIREENIRQAELEKNRKLVNDSLMQSWAGGVGQKSPELNKMASQYAEEEAASIKRQADAYKIAADAVAYLDREQAKLTMTNDLLSRGFTIASANALFRYKEAMEAAGQSAMQVKQNLYLLEQDLIKRQNTSPFAKMREDMQEMQKQTNHLARAISTQLGDVFISLASGQNPLTVMIQQGDQIRGAVEQAKAAGQDMSKAMQGAFASMANSFKLVGSVLKEFVVDGVSSVSNAMLTMVRQSSEITKIRDDLEAGLISPLRASRLEFVASANAMKTLGIAAGALAAVVGVTLLMAFVQLSNEQDKMAQSLAKTGGFFGATSSEAVTLSKSLTDVGIKSSTAATIIQEMAKAGNLGKESFAGIAIAANEAQKWVGISVDGTVKKFSELVKDPIKVLNEFAMQTGLLSQEQIGAVSALLDVGNAAGAQELAIKLLQQGYADMVNESKAGMSALGLATTELKAATSSLWDEFKNSTLVVGSIDAVIFVVGVLNAAVQTAVIAFKSLFAVVVAAGQGITNVYKNMLSPSAMLEGFSKIGTELKNSIVGALDSGAASVVNYNNAVSNAAGSVSNLTAEQRKARAEAAASAKALEAFSTKVEGSAKDQIEKLTKKAYTQKRLLEEVNTATTGLSAEQKQAFLSDEKYAKAATEALKKYGEEWEKAQKKSSGPKPKETYKVQIDQQLEAEKKLYDQQLKAIKDAESNQRKALKESYDAKKTDFGTYVAEEIKLTIDSKNKQLAEIKKYEVILKKQTEDRIAIHNKEAAAAIAAGGNAAKIEAQRVKEISNINLKYKEQADALDKNKAALEGATSTHFVEFYKLLNKELNDSNAAFEAFSKTIDNNAKNRQQDLELQQRLLGVYGAEAEAMKASASAMRSYSGEIDKQTDLLEKATKKRQELEKNLNQFKEGSEGWDEYKKALAEAVANEEGVRVNLANTVGKAQEDAGKAAADAVASYNIKVFQEVRDTVSGAIYDAIFEGGSKGANALKNVLENSFKNFVINAYINPIVGNVVGSVMGAMGMGSGLPGATGGGGFSLGGGSLDIGQSLIDYGYKVAGSSEFLGNAISDLGTGVKGLETSIKGIPGLEGGYGSLLGYGSAILNLSEGKYGSALGTGIGTSLMPTLGPLAPMVGSMLGSLLDDTLGDLFSGGPPNLGSAYSYNTKTGASKYYGGPEDIGEEADKVTAQLMESTVTGINDLFKKLGSAAKVEDFWGGFAAREDGGDSAWAGGTLSNGVKFGKQWSKDIETELGSVEEAMKQYQVELSKATLDALKQATDIPEYITSKLKDIDIDALSGDAVSSLMEEVLMMHATIQGVNTAFEGLGWGMDEATAKAGQYQLSLAESAGGIDNLKSQMQGYYENFYSESERSANAMKALTKEFSEAGIEMPTTRNEFRKMVEAAAASGDAGKEQLSSLLKLSDAFASLVPEVGDTFSAMRDSLEGNLAGMFSEVMRGTLVAQQAGTKVGEIMIQSITDTLTNAAAKQIEQVFFASIIEPIIANIMVGKAAAEGLDVAAAVAEVKQIATGLQEALSNPEIKSAIGEISSAMSQVADAAAGAASSISQSANTITDSSGKNTLMPTLMGSSSSASSVAAGGIGGVASAGSSPSAGLASFSNSVSSAKSSLMGFATAALDTASSMKTSSAYIADGNKWLKSFRGKDLYERFGEPIYTVGERDLYGQERNPGLSEEGAWALGMKIGDTYVYETLLKKQRELQLKLMELEEGSAPTSKYQEEKARYDTGVEYLNASGVSKDGINSKYEQESSALRRRFVEEMRNYSMENLIKDKQDAASAREKAAELKLTGGLEDPITKLKEQYRSKLKEVDDGIGKIINEEIEILKNTKPWAAKIETYEQNRDYIGSQIAEVQNQIAKDEAFLADAKSNGWDFTKYQASIESNTQTLNAYQTNLANLEQEYFDMVLAATSPEKQQALLDELAAYKGGVEEWFKAQAELMSTEMLIDINNQIKELEKVEKGPLTTIKDAIQKYVDDFTELGTLTEEVQTALNKLSDLQLTKAREELYNQLLPESELKLVQQTKLSKEFSDLGVALPGTAEALRSMIDAARAAGNITLADSLLELVPAFMALQGAAGGVSSAVDSANKAFDALQRAINARIKELEKTFTATDLALKVLEKLVDAEKKRINSELKTAQEQVNSLKKIFDLLGKTVNDLRGEVEQTSNMQAAEARVLLDTANLTGVLPDYDKVSDAVKALTDSVKSGLYATQYDKSRAFLTLANDFENLKDTTGVQLTSAEQTVVNLEKQIEQLDAVLEQARKQIDELRGIDASLFGIDENITSVDLAIQQLQTAAQAEEQARKQIDILNQQLEMYQRQIDAINNVDNSVKSVEDAIKALEAALSSINQEKKTTTTTPKTGGEYPHPYTPPETGGEYPIPFTESKAHLQGYANGGYTGNGAVNEIAGFVHKGEVVFNQQDVSRMGGPAKVEQFRTTGTLQQDNSELVTELQNLRVEVQMLRAEARATAMNTSKTARILDDVTQGGDTLKTEVAA